MCLLLLRLTSVRLQLLDVYDFSVLGAIRGMPFGVYSIIQHISLFTF